MFNHENALVWAFSFVIEKLCVDLQPSFDALPLIQTVLLTLIIFPLVSRFVSYCTSGCAFGTVIGMPVSGYLCEYAGWEVVF